MPRPRPPAQKLKARGLKFDIAFTSALKRAQKTCQHILDAVGQSDLKTIRDQALNERDYGDLSGLNKDDARARSGARSRCMSGAAPTTCRRPAAKA